MRILIPLFLIVFLAAPQAPKADARGIPLFYPRELLKSHEFEKLETIAARLNDGYLAGSVSYRDYFWFHQTLWKDMDISAQWLREAMNTWAEASPDSAYALLIRGRYLVKLGYRARGNRWASETKKHQFIEMDRHFADAHKVLDRGLKMEPDALIGHLQKIDIYKASRQQPNPKPLGYVKSLSGDVRSRTAIWSEALAAATPRWGGRYETMQETIETTIRADIPELPSEEKQILEDLITYDQMLIALANEDYDDVLEMADDSIDRKTGHAGIYVLASNAAQQLREYDRCFEDAGIGTSLRPWRGEGWLRRGVCAVNLKDWPAAKEAFRYRLAIRGGSSAYDLFQLGVSLMYHHEYADAYSLFKAAESTQRGYGKYTYRYVSYIEKDQPRSVVSGVTDLDQIIGELFYRPDASDLIM